MKCMLSIFLILKIIMNFDNVSKSCNYLSIAVATVHMLGTVLHSVC